MLDSPQNAQNDAMVLKTLQKVFVLPQKWRKWFETRRFYRLICFLISVIINISGIFVYQHGIAVS